jgi:glycosyltransferase involved in cell wall biosynthesis
VLFAALPRIIALVLRLRLLVVGEALDDNPLPGELRAEAARHGLADRVQFAGFRTDVPAILSAFDLKVLPSVCDEGVPQVLSQAMAMGVPVVSTAVGAIGELVEDGVTGRLVAPHDADALAEAVAAQLNDRANAQRMAVAARERVRLRYSVEVMAERTERLYQRLMAGGPAWPE